MQSEVEKLVERLREHATIFGDHEKLMSSQWDVMASMLRKGSHGSLPRDMFEALIDCIGEDTAEAASLIERLYRGRERLREATRPLVYAATGLSHGEDWNNGTHAKLHGYRQKLLDALPEAKAALAEQPQ